MDIATLKIKVKILQDKKTKAIISLDFGEIIIKGFRIQESKFPDPLAKNEKLWLTPPSYQGGGKYHPMFVVPNKERWNSLKEKIYTEFFMEQKLFNEKLYGMRDGDSGGL